MFVVDRTKELVGFSVWPWDSIYAPMVGCYHDGRLTAHAVCDQTAQQVGLDGPIQRWWFRLRVDPALRQALEGGDPQVRMVRMEDGAEVPYAGQAITDDESRLPWKMERFLSFSTRRAVRLDGFAAFVTAPVMHQLDILFLDILNRLPDPGARAHYGEMLESGVSIFRIREYLFNSQEFMERKLTISDRVGSLMTSSMWPDLARAEPLGARRGMLRRVSIADYADMSDEEFADQLHRDCHGDAPSDEARANFASIAQAQGRMMVGSLLVRDAANGGNFLDLVEA